MRAIITLGIAIIILACFAPAQAQVTGYANIYAEVVAPAIIEKSADLTFSEINTSGKSAAVILSSSVTPASAGILADWAGNGTLAAFSIAGSDHPTFDISLPGDAIAISSSGANPMLISDFTYESSNSGTLNSAGRIIKIGATLHIADKQPAGIFADQSSFQVTFNYN